MRTERSPRALPALATALLGLALAAAPVQAGLRSVSIEVPVAPKVDVTAYKKMMIGSFLTVKEARVDLEEETVRYLRKLFLRHAGLDLVAEPPPTLPAGRAPEALFTDADYWTDLGRRFGSDLILTGKVGFSTQDRSGYETEEVMDPRYRSMRGYYPSTRTIFLEKTGFYLDLEVFLLDGRTGGQIYKDTFHQEIVYDGSGPDDLSVFFLMLDRLAPQITGIIAERRTRVSRYLLD